MTSATAGEARDRLRPDGAAGEPAPGLHVRVVDHDDPHVRTAWARLAVASQNPFSTPEWCLAAAGDEPLVLLGVHAGVELVGALPLVTRRVAGRRVLEPPGAEHSDFTGPACAPRDEAAVAQALLAALRDGLVPWDLLKLVRILDGRAWATAVLADRDRGLLAATTWRSSAVLVDVPLSAVSPYRRGRDRRETQRLLRKLTEEHGATLRCSAPDLVASDVDALLALRRSKWSLEADSTEEALLRSVITAGCASGVVRLWVMEADGAVAAVLCTWVLGRRQFAYVMAFDPAYAALGPGTVLLGHAVVTAQAEGADAYDFLRGDERHKRVFRTGQRTATTWLVTRRRPLPTAGLAGAAFAQRAARHVKQARASAAARRNRQPGSAAAPGSAG